MRTHQEMLEEIRLRRRLGLPRIELTPEERRAAFGDPNLSTATRDPHAHDRHLVQRLQEGLYLSPEDRRRAKRFLKETT